jgi:hypothetical protein
LSRAKIDRKLTFCRVPPPLSPVSCSHSDYCIFCLNCWRGGGGGEGGRGADSGGGGVVALGGGGIIISLENNL